MKRVISFIETIDEIPKSAKYLGYEVRQIPKDETQKERNARIISGDESLVPHTTPLRIFFYEIDDDDFQTMIASGWLNKSMPDRINEFLKKYPPSKK
jgi:hypothetical protein